MASGFRPCVSAHRKLNGNHIMRLTFIAILIAFSLPAYAGPSCKDQVDAAFTKLRETKSFQLDTTIVNPQQGTLKMHADYVLPDRMHQKVMLGTDGAEMELIVIGKDAWANQGSGWAKEPDKFAEVVAKQLKETVAEAPKVSTDYTCAGDKRFEGHTYALYQGILPMPISPDTKQAGPRLSAVTVPKQQSVYIDKVTGLPVRNIVTPVTEPNNRLFDGTFVVVHDLTIEPPKTAEN